MGDNLVYAVRGSSGLSLRRGLGPDSTTLFEDKENPKENPCSAFQFSNDGRIFAYCDGRKTRAFEVASGREIVNVELRRTKHILFSPRDTHMITYEPYAIYGQKVRFDYPELCCCRYIVGKRLLFLLKVSADQKPEPNLHVYSIADGSCITTVVATKEATWMPQFSDDESVAARLVGSELLLHKGFQFGPYCVLCIYFCVVSDDYYQKIIVPNTKVFAVSPGHSPHHVACYTSAFAVCLSFTFPTHSFCNKFFFQSSPGRVEVRTLNPPFALITAKNFFRSDRAILQWNSKGSAVLVLSSTDVDASNQSYYGEQHIYLLNVTTQESFKVDLQKTGPVHAAKWNPNGKEFCVCYGFMPAMVSLFNTRGDEMFRTNEGPRNDVFYNGFGNLLLTCGFGNLGKGKMEFWDVEKKKQIVAIEVPNTTLFEWAPDGQHFLTATTTPRLRIDNGYRMWHYSGKLINEVLCESSSEELWEVNIIPLTPINKLAIVKFRPMPSYNKFEVRELTKAELESAGLLIKKKDSTDPNNKQPVGAAKPTAAYVPPHLRKGQSANARSPITPKPVTAVKMTETEKKIFVIKKKLRDVGVLKARLANGEELQTSQLEKIAKEPEFLAQLTALGGAL
ncbi:unnamed protein product [Angiostrongylus costaricensis]|uniref:Eukaryotic translation initiation factor 2A n=1 Tax=Angiostrongylus costaricensis TaxID=334426 RepID=A0A0R3PL40_ANGCS|nr:unnamed protein product [Angiostrongylus costaricensis]